MHTLIVDDHLLFSAGLSLLLQATGNLGAVDCAESGEQALQQAAKRPYDLVLLDWHLGREPSGVALIEQLQQVLPHARVVMVSGESSPDLVRRAIDAGAVGFVPKESSPEAMIKALDIVARGGIFLPEAALAAHAARGPQATLFSRTIPPGEPAAAAAARSGCGATLTEISAAFPDLTTRHVQVLGHIVRGLSNKEIARDLGIAEGTVKQHTNAIFKELSLQNRTEAVYLLAKMGVRFS